MRVEIEHVINVIELAYECGRLRSGSLERLEELGIGEQSYGLYAEFDRGEQSGIFFDPADITTNFDAISSALCFPFDLGDYKILVKAVADELDRFARSDEAEQKMTNQYHDDVDAIRENEYSYK